MTTFHYVLIAIAVLALIFGAILGFASVKLKVEADPIVEKIDAILPQSQCGQCGYPGCKPYAEAIANGDVITKCIPGGQPTVVKIAELLGVDVPATDFEESAPAVMVAFIDEEMCIGCTKCIQACPVDAIIGTNKAMHTIIPDLCTGCELCVAPCPTDCISMIKIEQNIDNWDWKVDSVTIDPKLVIPVVNTTYGQKTLIVGEQE